VKSLKIIGNFFTLKELLSSFATGTSVVLCSQTFMSFTEKGGGTILFCVPTSSDNPDKNYLVLLVKVMEKKSTVDDQFLVKGITDGFNFPCLGETRLGTKFEMLHNETMGSSLLTIEQSN
jgi:hypothetical protein